MCSAVQTGVLRGRPFGSVVTLVNKKPKACTKIVCDFERFVIITVCDLVVKMFIFYVQEQSTGSLCRPILYLL